MKNKEKYAKEILDIACNGNSIAIISEGTQVLITERATSKVGGYYWDKVSTPRGTGYMAREASDGSKTYLVVIGSNKNDNIAEPDENNIITSEPGTTANTIKKKYSNAVIVDKNGNEITGDTIVKLGDCDGDGKINSMDMYNIIQHMLNKITIQNEFFKAIDTNHDNKIDSMDMYNIIQIILKNN